MIHWLKRTLFDGSSDEGSCCLSLDYVPSHLELAGGMMEVPFLYIQETNRKVAIESSALPRLKPAPRGVPLMMMKLTHGDIKWASCPAADLFGQLFASNESECMTFKKKLLCQQEHCHGLQHL